MDELTKEFLAESLEGLDRMDRCLTELESRPDDAALLGEIFRSVHTIKGTTGFLGFGRLEKLAHAGENLLGALRDGKLQATSELVNGLLKLMDGLRAILLLIERTGREGEREDDNDEGLIALMQELLTGEAKVAKAREGEAPVQSAGTSASGSADRTLRIDVDVLNRMVNLVGELVLTRNQLLQSKVEAALFPQLARRLDSVTADLRETVMQARMQPVGHLFGKFPRMVRDLARSCGKQVRIEFLGQETGLDKTLIEAIKDPLTHALRNAIDHGVEAPRERMLAGKPAQGTVWMRARHQSGSVVIEIEDDGGGISRERVLAKALTQGLVSEERAAAMTDREAQQLIFMPGFSTAATVSHVSGRGVGMDVVRTSVEKAGGTVEVDSQPGVGTVLRLRVPLTLAIVPALVVESGGESFCLPQTALAELVNVPNADAERLVERIGEVELYRLRDELLPMVWLDRLLGLDGKRKTRCANGFYLAVLETDGCRFGLALDDLLAPEEIVVKPVSAVLRDIGLFSGATVLGNGRLAMILDVAATAALAGVQKHEVEARAAEPVLLASVQKSTSFLVFEEQRGFGEQGRNARAERMALPLEAVERIESVAAREVEWVGGRLVLQYRGELLPLEDAGDVLRDADADDVLTVLICTRSDMHKSDGGQRSGGRRVGLVVRQVLDVAEGSVLPVEVEVCTERLALVKDRLTVVRDSFGMHERGLREVA